jgi:trans-2,3-dihydro-3-hydroxyanthranilate isomerase
MMQPMLRKYGFVQVDVFHSQPLKGNPLAVFTDARGLSSEEMLAIAREMNLSETTFILPRDAAVEQERGVRVRIFTPEEELPFAGHPTLGTAYVMRGASGASDVRLELNAGRILVTFSTQADGRVFGEMLQRDPEFGAFYTPGQVAPLAGLDASDLATEPPIQTVSCGLPFAIVPVKSLEAIMRVALDWRQLREFMSHGGDAFSFFFVTRETGAPEARLHARMIFSNGEDPATGSAAGCCAAWMVKYGVAQPDEQVMIEQGLEVHRPSEIYVRASLADGRVTNVRVGGHVAEVIRGELVF